MTNEFEIRSLTVNDWEAFKAIRLEALSNHPEVFGASIEHEKEYGPSDWQSILDGAGKRKIHGGFKGDNLVGISGIVTDRDDPSGKTAVLIMWYLQPAYRGAGLFEQIVLGSILWAKDQSSFERIIVSHRNGNEASRKANQKLGFRFTHIQPETWPDGKTDDKYMYERKIER